MNRRLLAPLLAGVLVSGAFAASAQTLAPSPGVDASAAANFDSSPTPQIDRNCLRQTGSRIVARYNSSRQSTARDGAGKTSQRCVAANGRVYSREDIELTGEVNIADALRKLDPAIH